MEEAHRRSKIGAEQETEPFEVNPCETQNLEAIGTLASGIAHDFNNILAAIVGFTELALADIPPQNSARPNLQRVLKASQRARELITRIQAFSSRKKPQNRRPMHPATVVASTLQFLQTSLPATVEIRQFIAAGGKPVLADPVQLQQAVMNLCTNAAYAMRESGGVLEVRLTEVELDETGTAARQKLPAGRYWRLSIKDTGCGMNAEVLERIFNPYFTTKETGEGSGLGLAVVHGIVQRHQGAITVASEPGRGTVFHIFLPTVAEEQQDKDDWEDSLPSAELGSERILYVDDEEALVDLGKQMLTRLGYQVVAVDDSRKALELFRAQPNTFDLIFSDYTMPHLTGTELAAKVLQIRPDMPIILCSGHSEEITQIRAKELGIQHLTKKPLRRKELAEVIRKALEKR